MCGEREKRLRALGVTGNWRGSHQDCDQAVQSHDVGWVLLALCLLMKLILRALGSIRAFSEEIIFRVFFWMTLRMDLGILLCVGKQ